MRSTRKNKAKVKPPGSCIFCKGQNLSHQHLWPMWLTSVLPPTDKTHRQLISRVDYSQKLNGVTMPTQAKIRQGHVGTRKVRNVCVKCNGGWMSKLENEAKPILSSLVLNQAIVLDKQSTFTLAKWIVMTSIMMEFSDTETISVSREHREFLMREQDVPAGWKIWIGKHKSEKWKQTYLHSALSKIDGNNVPVVINMSKLPINTQFSTIGIGNLVIHVVSKPGSLDSFEFDDSIRTKLFQIVPAKHDVISWPTVPVLDEYEINFIAYFFYTSIQRSIPVIIKVPTVENRI